MPTADNPSGSDADPHGFAVAFDALGLSSRRGAKASAVVAAALLEDGENVEMAIAGRIYAESGLAVLTDRRLLLVNDRQFKPDVVEFAIAAPLEVAGWQDNRTASLTFSDGRVTIVIDSIKDKDHARVVAARLRERVG